MSERLTLGYVRSLLERAPILVRTYGKTLLWRDQLKSFSWDEEGTVLKVEVNDREDAFMVRIADRGEGEEVTIACTCFPGGGLCRHGAGALLGIEAILRERFPVTDNTDEAQWKYLAAEFRGEIIEKPTPVVKAGPFVLIDLDSRSDFGRFAFYWDETTQLKYGIQPPSEVRDVVKPWGGPTERAAAFQDWLKTPGVYGLNILQDGEMTPAIKQPAVRVRAETELDLRDGEVVLRQRLWNSETAGPVKVVARVLGRLLLLEEGTFGWIEEESHEGIWEMGVAANPDPEEREWVLPDASGFQLFFEVEQWNELNVPWPLPGMALEEAAPLFLEGTPVDDLPIEEAQIHLEVDVRDGQAEIHVAMASGGAELTHPGRVIGTAMRVRNDTSKTFMNSAARRSAFLRAAFGLIVAERPKERNEIVRGARKLPAIARIKKGGAQAARGLRKLERLYREVPEMTLHGASIQGEESETRWFVLRNGFRLAAGALGLVMEVFPKADSNGELLQVQESELLDGLPRLMALGEDAGISVLFNGKEVGTMKLDFLVKATRDATNLDWFALSSEVVADGSVIPQERWESLMKSTLMHEPDGSVRVLDVKSALTLEKLRQVIQAQTAEAGIGKQKGATGLRIPRLRIFDWLALRQAGVRCELPPEDAETLRAVMSFDKLPILPLPKKLKANLRPYQKEGYEWLSFLYRHRFGACLADDMGLGKTIQTIALLGGIHEGIVRQAGVGLGKKKPKRVPHLIILPPTLIFNWQHEIETFYPELRVEEFTGAQRDIDAIESDVILTTYELVRRDIEVLEKRRFDVIVFDEAQAIKNLTGERSKAMRRLKANFKVCLTGTPLENHVGEYYSILELALPGLFGDYRRFMQSLNGEGFQPIERARPFVLRRTKEKILQELPPKVETDVWLNLTDTQKVYYSRAVAEVREEVFQAFQDKTAQQAGIAALSALMRLRQICISPALIDPDYDEVSPKVEYLLEKVVELRQEGHASLVFSQFTRTLDLVERHLVESEIEYLRIDGSTPQARRKANVAAFQKSTGPEVFLVSLKTGGVGLNLTRASYVFHLDPWWNPAVESQASDRAHRIGQTQRVFVNRLLMRHTVEEKMMLLKERKRALFDEVFSGTENRTGSGLLTRDDMAWLLEID